VLIDITNRCLFTHELHCVYVSPECVPWLCSMCIPPLPPQEAEGTFMVAFSSADVAVEWCLMVQQVLRDMSWPAR
jgi:hypothetical protein